MALGYNHFSASVGNGLPTKAAIELDKATIEKAVMTYLKVNMANANVESVDVQAEVKERSDCRGNTWTETVITAKAYINL